MYKILSISAAVLLLDTVVAAASCPSESIEWQTSCYYFATNASDYSSSEAKCVSLGGHLASIHDGFINSFLKQNGQEKLNQSSATEFRIGLTKIAKNWTWADGTSFDFNDWAKGEPATSGKNTAIVSLTDGYWKTIDYAEKMPYVCKIDKSISSTVPPTNKCPFPFMYFEPTQSCYGVSKLLEHWDWKQAEEYCESIGGHSVSIHSHEELQFLEGIVYVSNSGFWTGAFSNDSGITWKWSDATSWDFDVWDSGYPKLKVSACGNLIVNGLIDDACNSQRRTLCKFKL